LFQVSTLDFIIFQTHSEIVGVYEAGI